MKIDARCQNAEWDEGIEKRVVDKIDARGKVHGGAMASRKDRKPGSMPRLRRMEGAMASRKDKKPGSMPREKVHGGAMASRKDKKLGPMSGAKVHGGAMASRKDKKPGSMPRPPISP